MTTSTACLSERQLVELARDEINPRQWGELEQHLSQCERCRQALDDYDDGYPWLREVHTALSLESNPEEVSKGDEFHKDTDATLRDIVRLLGPTDDPRMLGRIGVYEVVGVLGRGGMGIVFKAFDPALNRYVAVKMLLPHLAATGAARKRFAREAQAAAAVVNDHVMPIHSVAEFQGLPFLVMPYGQGESLQKRLHDRGSLELPEILRIGMQTAKGLAAAHAQGLVHRDVKPANILLNEGVDRVVLTDFGLARAVDDIGLTREGQLAGTPQYMSPEQASGQAVDSRSDLFSLGCVLYVMCTGIAPFRAESSYAVLRQITDHRPQPIRALNPAIPVWLERIVGKLLAKDMEKRYQSAGEVAELLECCLAHVQQPMFAALPADVVAEPLVTPSSPRRGLRPFVIGLGLTMLCLAVGLGVTALCFSVWFSNMYFNRRDEVLRPPAPAIERQEEVILPDNRVTDSVEEQWNPLQSELDAVDAGLRQLEGQSRRDLNERGDSARDELDRTKK